MAKSVAGTNSSSSRALTTPGFGSKVQDSFITRCRGALFGVLFLAAKDSHVSNTTAVTLAAVRTAQMCGFAVAGLQEAAGNAGRFQSGMAALSGILDTLRVGSIVGTLDLSPDLFTVLLWLSVAFSTITSGLFLHVAYTIMNAGRHRTWSLKVMRSAALLGSTVLFIPVTSMQLGWMACRDATVVAAIGGPTECFQSGHLAGVLAVVLTLPAFIAVAGLTAACYVDHALTRLNYNSKLHGRADVALLLGQVFVIALFELTPPGEGLWFKVTVLMVLSAMSLHAFIVSQPHALGPMNDIRAGLSGAFAWTSLCLLVAWAYPQGDSGLLLLGGILPAVGMAAAAARVRRSSVEISALGSLHTAADMHRWGLARVRQYNAVLATSGAGDPLVSLLQDVGIGDEVAASSSDSEGSHDLMALTASRGAHTARSAPNPSSKVAAASPPLIDDSTAARDSRPVAMPHMHSLSRTSSIESTRPPMQDVTRPKASKPKAAPKSALSKVSKTSPSAAVVNVRSAHTVTVAATPRMARQLLRAADRAFCTAAGTHGATSLAHFTKSSFYRYFRSSRYIEYVALNDAKAGGPMFDVAFFVYQRTRQLQEAQAEFTSAGEAKLSAIDRVVYDQHWAAAVKAEVDWHTAQVRVWDVLAGQAPSATELHTAGVQLSRALITAQGSYDCMLAMNPNSSRLLRAMGSYRIRMCGDMDAGNALLGRAERMESAAFARAQAQLPAFHFGARLPNKSFVIDETAALITASGTPASVGEIMDANTTAARMFACTVPTLVSKGLPELLPPVLGEGFENSLLQYTGTGDGVAFDTVTLGLVQDVGGHLVPVQMLMQETPSVDASMTMNFTLALQRVNTPYEMILAGGAGDSYRIISATPASFALLGLEAGELTATSDPGLSSLLRFIPQVDEVAAAEMFGYDAVLDRLAGDVEGEGGRSTSMASAASPRARAARRGSSGLVRHGSAASIRANIALRGPTHAADGCWVVTDMSDPLGGSFSTTVQAQVQQVDAGTSPLVLLLWAKDSLKKGGPAPVRPRPSQHSVVTAIASGPKRVAILSPGSGQVHHPVTLPASAKRPQRKGSPHPQRITMPPVQEATADVMESGESTASSQDSTPTSSEGGQPKEFSAPASSTPPLDSKRLPPLDGSVSMTSSTAGGDLWGAEPSLDLARADSNMPASPMGLPALVASPDALDKAMQQSAGALLGRAPVKEEEEEVEYAGTYGGGSSTGASSVSSNARRARFLLRSVLGRGLHPAITAVVWSFTVLFLVMVGTAVGFCSFLVLERTSAERSEASLVTGFARTEHFLSAVTHVQHLVLDSGDHLPMRPLPFTQLMVEFDRHELEVDHEALTADHRILYNKGGRVVVDGETVVVQDTSDAGASVPIALTVPEATQWFIGQLQHISALPPADVTTAEPHAASVVRNALTTLLPAFEENTAHKLEVYLEHEHEQDFVLFGVFIGLFLVCVVASSVYLWSKVAALRAHRVKLLDIFTFIPRKAARRLKGMAQSALLTSMTTAQNELGSLDEDLDLDVEAALAEERGAGLGSGPGEGEAAVVIHKLTARALARSSRRTPLTHAWEQDMHAGVRMWLPVLFIGVFLASVFVTNEQYRLQRKQLAQGAFYTQSLLDGLLLMDIHQAAALSDNIRALQTPNQTLADVRSGFQDAHDFAHEELSILLRGDPSGPIDGVSTSGPLPETSAFTLLLQNACPFVNSPFAELDNATFFSEEQCTGLDAGVFTSGLQGAVLRYLSLSSRALADTLAAREGNGGLLPPSFNVSEAYASQVTAAGLLHPYMLQLASLSTIAVRGQVAAAITQETGLLFGISAALITVLLVAMVVYFIPHAKAHGEATVATQILLTILPGAMLTADVEMHEAVVEVVEVVEAAFPDAGIMSAAHKYMT